MKFEELNLIPAITQALAEQGYTAPTPIQAQAIPPALEGRDVLGCAQTGTGKTCAFAAPILQRLNGPVPAGRPVRALVLTPTRELAIQNQECFEAYGKHLPLKSVVIFGGVGQGPQVAALQAGCDILVATPGRLADLHGQGLADLSKIEIFVLDEADRMLDMGFIHDVKKILAWLPKKKQTLFFSATMPKEITELVNSLLHDPARVAVDPVSSPVERIDQSLYYVDKGNKTKLLVRLLDDPSVTSALVFTRTKHGANKVAGDLVKAGISAAAIHGNKSQTARQAALSGFKAGDIRVLVATDIAARGLDIEYLSHVFNYNLPEVPETYVHRIGRTGRAGHGGRAIAFCDFSEKPLVKDIEKLMGRTIPVVEDHPYPMEVFTLPPKDKNGRVVNAEDAEARAAARERRRQRTEAARQQAAEGAEKPAAGRRSRRKKAAAPAAVEPAAPVKKTPAPAAEKPAKAPRRKKAASLGLEESDAPLANWSRKEAREDGRIMDATARLLSSRTVLPESLKSGKRTARKEKKEPGEAGEEKRARRGGKRLAPKGEEKSAAVRREKKTPAKPAGRLLTPDKRRRRTHSTPPPIAPSIHSAHQKDSTQQHSLMKPYYITKDD